MSDIVLAGRGRRLVATVIDAILVPIVAVFLMLMTGALEHAEDYVGSRWLYSIVLLGMASYLLQNGWLLFSRGQTVGKAALGVMIVRTDGDGVPAIARLLVRGIVFLLFPVIGVLFIVRGDRRCLHDLICGTQVVNRES